MKIIEVKCGGETLSIPRAETYRDCLELARSDAYRYTGRRESLRKMLVMTLLNKGFSCTFWMRLASIRGWLYPLAKLKVLRNSQKYGLQIAPTCLIGYGLYIGHGFGTIVSPSAVIGNNCNLGQFTTIGRNGSKAGILGNNVYVGTSACILGDVIVGSGATVGAGAVVVRDVPSGITVGGVPARTISESLHPEFFEYPYPLQ